jgi:hypothetical protein
MQRAGIKIGKCKNCENRNLIKMDKIKPLLKSNGFKYRLCIHSEKSLLKSSFFNSILILFS